MAFKWPPLTGDRLDRITERLLAACTTLFVAAPLLSYAQVPSAALPAHLGVIMLAAAIALNAPRLLQD